MAAAAQVQSCWCVWASHCHMTASTSPASAAPTTSPPLSPKLYIMYVCKVHWLPSGSLLCCRDWMQWEILANPSFSLWIPVHPLSTLAFLPLLAPLTYSNFSPTTREKMQRQQLFKNYFTRSQYYVRSKIYPLYHITQSHFASLLNPKWYTQLSII